MDGPMAQSMHHVFGVIGVVPLPGADPADVAADFSAADQNRKIPAARYVIWRILNLLWLILLLGDCANYDADTQSNGGRDNTLDNRGPCSRIKSEIVEIGIHIHLVFSVGLSIWTTIQGACGE